MHGLIEVLRRDYGSFAGYAEAIGVGGVETKLRAALLSRQHDAATTRSWLSVRTPSPD